MDALRRALAVIGGPNAATWPGFWVMLIAGIAGNWAAGGVVDAPLAARLAVAAIPVAFGWLPLLLVRATVLRGADPRPRPLLVIAAIMVGGTVRGMLTDALYLALGWTSTSSIGYRIVSGVVAFSVVIVLMAFVVDSARAHGRRMRQLRELADQLDQARTTARRAALERNDAVVQRIQERLVSEIARLDAAHPGESLASLQSTASDVVRPLSHELASHVPTWAPDAGPGRAKERLDWRAVVSGPGGRQPLAPLLTACLVAVLLIPAAVWQLSGWAKLAIPVVGLLSTWGALELANRAIDRVSGGAARWRIAATIAAVSVAGLAVGLGVLLASVATSASRAGGLALGAVFFVPVFAGSVGIVKAVRDLRLAIEQRLLATTEEMRWQLARVGQVQWVQQRSLSRALHGPVQAAVNAAAIRLDAAIRDGGDAGELVTELQSELIEVIGLLDTSAVQEQHRLEVNLQRVHDTWAGIAEVEVDIDDRTRDALALDDIAETCVLELIGESISNAIRHGHAGAIHVRARIDAAVVDLCIRDDGVAVKAEQRGLGFKLLDEMAVSWHRQICDDGFTELRAEVPIETASTTG